MEHRDRVVGIILKDKKVLLLRRFRNEREYYVFPGGGVENSENLEIALNREIKEELGLSISNPKLLFELEQEQEYYGKVLTEKSHYFLVEEFSGNPELGGPEKEKMNQDNQFHLEWINVSQLPIMENLFPKQAAKNFITIYEKS